MVEIAGINLSAGGRDSRIPPTHNFRERRRVNYFCAQSIFCFPISSAANELCYMFERCLKYFLSLSFSFFFFLIWKASSWQERLRIPQRREQTVWRYNFYSCLEKGKEIFLKRPLNIVSLEKWRRGFACLRKIKFSRVSEVIRDLFPSTPTPHLEIEIGGHYHHYWPGRLSCKFARQTWRWIYETPCAPLSRVYK